MKILVLGAGVIGSLYAARLHEVGVDVTLLARGARYEMLGQQGVMINNVLTGTTTTRRVPLTRELRPTDRYDLIVVTVRLDQLESVMDPLQHATACPLIMLHAQ